MVYKCVRLLRKVLMGLSHEDGRRNAGFKFSEYENSKVMEETRKI